MLRVTIEYSGMAGSPYYSRFYFDGTGQTAAENSAAAVLTFLIAAEGVQSNLLVWSLLPEVEEVNSSTGLVTASYSVSPATGTGNSGNEPLPTTMQALIRWRTGVYEAGREIRGRTFVPGMVQDANNSGTLTGTVQEALSEYANALVDDVDSELVVYSPTHQQFATVTGASCWNNFAVLRSRRGA